MNKEKDRIYYAALIIVSCSQSLKFIIKDLYEMEEHANKHGGEYQGLSNIIEMMAQTIETQVWEIIDNDYL